MANLQLQDQANAIWKALDDMLEKDPEGYKRYIEEQMKEAKSLKSKDPKFKDTGKEGQGSTQSGTSPMGLGLDMLLGQLGINNTRKSQNSAADDKPMSKKVNKKPKAGKGMIDSPGGDNNNSGKSLLDDNIGNSVIASIVSNKIRLEGCEEDERDELQLVDIKIPSDLKNVKKGKPLIEEL